MWSLRIDMPNGCQSFGKAGRLQTRGHAYYAHFAGVEDGKAKVIADTTDDNREDVMTAIEGCPVAAISE